MRVQVKVTNYNIRKGQQCHGDSCPIALAVQKNLKSEYNVAVESDGSIYITGDNDNSYDDTPITTTPSVKRERFVEKFDNGEKVKPMVFLLNLPKKILKSNANVVTYN